ncbi:MAG: acyl-CoA carboxylase subunit beta [Firmicutes bacterium]|nr:acyl-CoA carboxylase subunit beta [Bacillota bacterium]
MSISADEKLKRLVDYRSHIKQGGGDKRIEEQHARGKLTARERLALLFDEGSFEELNLFAQHRTTNFGLDRMEFPSDGVITGFGKVNGRKVYAYAQDFTVAGGAAGEIHEKKIAILLDLAAKSRAPVIGIHDSGGARIQEGALSLSGYGEIFYRNTLLSGLVPQIAVIAGPCAGGAAYSPVIMDFVFMVDGISRMFVTGPENLKTVTGEVITAEELGGARVHAEKSGVCHFLAENEEECFKSLKKLISYLPAHNAEKPPHNLPEKFDFAPAPELNELVPSDSYSPYDMKIAIDAICDKDSFYEILPHYAKNVIIGLARINGFVTGIVANQPNENKGYLNGDASCKATRFIRFCNCFNIPLLHLVDVPGFVPGIKEEHGGILRHGAKLLFSLSAATVPKITVILRKAYGGTFLAMGSKAMGSDRVIAWHTAEISVLDAEAAVRILYRKELKEAEDQEQKFRELVAEYKRTFSNPYSAAGSLLVDDIIEPAQTRKHISLSLEAFINKEEVRPKKKHGNIPL